jgi:hypothetical protein
MKSTELEKHDGQRNSADIIIIDSLPPEESAMSQAIYARKPKSILYTILRILEKGAQNFMSMFYSGYGHNSIGDCGTLTLYFENISMLAAKAMQAWSLYNGQEASTRYLDFNIGCFAIIKGVPAHYGNSCSTLNIFFF